MIVQDIKPTISFAEDVKPIAMMVEDIKPIASSVSGETQVYYDLVTLLAGQPMGLLLCLTYAGDISSTNVRT